MSEFCIVRDDSAHWYVIPADEVDQFESWHEWMCWTSAGPDDPEPPKPPKDYDRCRINVHRLRFTGWREE